ncbi:hypothetical protein GCK72_003126 [Caenorhabditis remanei]|uniref:F-box domain-containing protein n=1 Tax=Caenorhabditis remanei TaxID=31234 RepID=A0A6A5HSY6_CAERE|nr:hypothetical protein GCK72_003126 [Caenorhabditis remanei]KAF1771300.1 hypothetical protein GCK72_003126 [Caenorhabditis remanei]
MSSPFPLLRLPGLVLCEIFKSLSIGEKIKLSFCSKKTSTQINNAQFYSQKVIVDLDMLSHKIRVCSKNNQDIFEIFTYQDSGKNLNTHQLPIECCTTGIKTFWKNDQEGFLSVIQHLLKIFRCKISISNNYNSDLYQPTISMLFDLQVEFKTLTICFDGSKDQNLLWNQISSNFGLVEYLTSFSNPGFNPVFTSWPRNISFISSEWVTLESLLACTCTTIKLDWSDFGNKDLDEILKKWKTGGFANLKRLVISSQNIKNNGELILGMNLMELNGKVIQADDVLKKSTIRIDSHIQTTLYMHIK